MRGDSIIRCAASVGALRVTAQVGEEERRGRSRTAAPRGEPSALPLCYHRKAERVRSIYVTPCLKERACRGLKERACRASFLQRFDIGRSNLQSSEAFR